MNSSNFPKVSSDWTLFLDRDGVINKRIVDDYVRHVDQFEILPGVIEAIVKCCSLFHRVVVVTNQQGIGKGLMTKNDVNTIHAYLQGKVKHYNQSIDAFYFAPQLASDKSIMRKPNIGMALAAMDDFPSIDLHKSIMVGDSISDMQFGKNAGMFTVFVGEETENQDIIDYFVPTLESFSKLF